MDNIMCHEMCHALELAHTEPGDSEIWDNPPDHFDRFVGWLMVGVTLFYGSFGWLVWWLT